MIEVFRDPYFQCELNELDDLRTEANFTKIKVIAQKLLEDAKIQSNTYVEIIANYYLAEAALFSGETEKCIELSWHVLSFYKDRDYDNVFVLICSILGKAYGNQRDSYNALTFFLKGYYAAIDKKIPAVEYRILGNIGTLFFYLGYHEDAIIFYKRALRRISEIGSVDKKVYEVLLVNIMSVYIRMKDFVNVDKWKDLYEKEFPDTHNTVGEEGYIADKIIKSANVNNFKK